jgi:serine/threonine protein kinase
LLSIASQHTYPVRERRIHSLATLAGFLPTERPVPPLLCAFASPAALHLVTSFHQSGSLWDVLSLHPAGRLPEPEARHWAAGMVDAIGWLHDQGWAHRDVKPHNFLIDAGARGPPRILLTDFGTAAEEVRKSSGRLAREDCLWPVGTPDYIAPDVLEAHEDALVRAEEDAEQCEAGLDPVASMTPSPDGYGLEVDWWSLGVVLLYVRWPRAAATDGLADLWIPSAAN